MRSVAVTGASGFIGQALCRQLSQNNRLIGLSHEKTSANDVQIESESVELTNADSVTGIFKRNCPDVMVHCAGIAHQKIGAVDSVTYMLTNSEATENLAKEASRSNPDVKFIFLSSVSVYGEYHSPVPVSENDECRPSSHYAVSKLDAERRLLDLYDKGIIHNLIILRLAPVYDRDWSLNLDRRIFAPLNLVYMRFGSGHQKMSALARPNLVDFVEFLLQQSTMDTELSILNICDSEPYEFNTIIRTFKQSGVRPKRSVLPVPLFPIWAMTRLAGMCLAGKREWIHSCYEKLASDLVFSNKKMLETGFRHAHSLKTIFPPEDSFGKNG